ncbi:glycosyltransferase family 4 protein [Paenisporosarcina quisquiliarum]|uniref:Glycosyltransferase family 4 protein n=1 Tax=Paenisporosarcina quisquiliarum TaxID=365346 RepID=A0A9X3RDM9_9BACL|nr:glycosyltransferase [Paenisporosarcina quisquiliarum]MCZ8537254.1 glycosyltransferase family 4 protein [Paenisporosarcina quisquiliarum]
MRVLFCHDGPLKKDEFSSYYGIAHNDETFKRYYSIAEKLSVIIRVSNITKEEAEEKLSKITVSPFDVRDIPNISNLKGILFDKKRANQIITEAVMNTDFVVARLPSMIGNIAIDIAKKLNKPYLIEVVACPWDAFWNHSLIGKFVAPAMYYATKNRVADATHVVYVTNEFLQNRYPTNGFNINCSNVSLREFNESVLNDRLMKISSTKKDNKIIIGTTGAIDVKYKGQQYIIEALGKLKKEGNVNYEYHLVGGGNKAFLESVAYKNDVSGQVKFLGSLPHKDIFKWLDKIDIYVQPSKQEGLPRALIEAMSRALPAFGANTAGIPELIDKEFIFSNSRKNINEICKILKKFDFDTMKVQSAKNFNESKKYNRSIIEKRRKKFFNEFVKHKGE